MLKKTTLAVLGLAASGFASAGTMGPVCTPGNVTVPCEAKLWDIGVQALYLRPLLDADRSYAQNVLPQYTEIKNDWDWGYRLEGSYHFNTGNDLTINWSHFRSDVHQDQLHGSVLPLALVGAVNIPYTINNEDRYDQVNFVFGQHVDFGLVKKMRFYGGLQYANIQLNAANFYPFTYAPLLISSVSLYDNTDFKGVGPVIGLDYAYTITPELSLTANGQGSILYGTSRYNTGYVIAPANASLLSIYASKKEIVPSLEAKLGLNYAYAMPQGVLNIAGGYQVVNYFNALQGQTMQVFTSNITNSDYGLYGPYLGVNYVGNV